MCDGRATALGQRSRQRSKCNSPQQIYTRVQVSAAALLAEEDTSDASDTEANGMTEGSGNTTDDTPPTFESSNDSDLVEATDGTDPSITVPAN